MSNDRIKSAYPLQSHYEKTDDQFINDYARRRGLTQVLIIGVDARGEYIAESYGENETEIRFAERNMGVVTKALREEGLTRRLI